MPQKAGRLYVSYTVVHDARSIPAERAGWNLRRTQRRTRDTNCSIKECPWELADADLRNRSVYDGSLLVATFHVACTVNLILICKPKEPVPRNLVEFGGARYPWSKICRGNGHMRKAVHGIIPCSSPSVS